MLFLISDVTHDLGHAGLADTEGAVSRLPLESATQSAALMYPSGGIRLDNPDRVGEGQSRREPQEQVNMVCRSISSQWFASQFPHDAADVSQQIGLEFGVNQAEPTFGAEHDVEEPRGWNRNPMLPHLPQGSRPGLCHHAPAGLDAKSLL